MVTALPRPAPTLAELTQLRGQLEDMRATFDSIRSGGVDAIMVGDLLDERVYTLASADRPYRVILDEMGEGAVTVSERGVLLYANRRFAALVGRDIGALVGTDVTGLVGHNDHPQLLELLGAPAGVTRRGELNLLGPGGRIVPALSSATGLDVEGVLVRCLIVADLTERKRTEQELAKRQTELEKINAAFALSNAELERSNRELEVYASAISHDLREPLRTTAGFVDLVRTRYAPDLPEGGRELFGFVLTGIERMEARISTILDYARSGAGVAPPHAVDSGGVAAAAVLDVASIVRDSGAQLTVGELPIVQADTMQLQRVFQNLLTNAVLHRLPDAVPRISIEARRLDLVWRFTVADNGPGVPTNARERIFDMFSRGASTSLPDGHGMGLALCRRIVESYGGRIWVQDNPGGGSQFCFTLPTAEPVPPSNDTSEVSSAAGPGDEAFRWIFGHTRDGVIITTIDGAVLAANPAMCAMTGQSEVDLRVQGPPSWLDSSDRIRWSSAVAQRQATGNCQLELSVRHSDGTRFPAALTSAILTNNSGRSWACTVIRNLSTRIAQSAGRVNDDLVQSLVAAEMAFDLGHLTQARESLASASQAARNWGGELLLATGEPAPGSLVRSRPPVSMPDGTAG